MTPRPAEVTEPERCAVAARARRDPLVATAAPATRWLLVEQTGPWGRRALTESRLDPEVGAELERRLQGAGGRTLLVRKHGRTAPGPRRWAIVDAEPGRESLRWGTVADDHELLDLPLDAPREERRVPVEPVYLACTHGRHDRCCAQDGRPVALALDDERPDHTWECSHLGGDRFAANVLVLPWGLCYGGVGPNDATALIAATDDGRVLPHFLRGRSAFTPAEQAAQHLAREATGLDGIDDLRPLAHEPAGEHRWRVVLEAGVERLTCVVRVRTSPSAARLTCGATHASRQREWELDGLSRTPAAPVPRVT